MYAYTGAGTAQTGLNAKGLRLEIEPGRVIHGNGGIHLTTVKGIKRLTTPIHPASFSSLHLNVRKWLAVASRIQQGGEMQLREVLQQYEIVIAPGAYDAASARIIEKAGFPVLYVTGLGNEASDIGYPDLGLTTATESVRRAWNIVQRARVPVICDADTGFGGALNLYRTIRMFESAGISGVHIEDQTFPKRCGALAGKRVIPAADFARKIRAAVDARQSDDFVIIARTDAKSSCGIEGVIRRLNLYVENGADLGMLGDFYSLEEYDRIVKAVHAPVIAVASCHGLFSRQPDISVDDWQRVGIKMVLYWHLPLFAAMRAVTRAVLALKECGTTDQMQADLFSYAEYEEVMQLQEWLRRDEKYGEREEGL